MNGLQLRDEGEQVRWMIEWFIFGQLQLMEKTGIASIDKFFNYGEPDSFQPLPFTPQIDEVIEMFRSEYTEALYDRKANAIIKFCENRSQGFFYEEIDGLTQLFDFARVDLFESGMLEMVPAIQAMLLVISQDPNNMFNKNAGSDELRYLRLVPTFLDSLEPFLRYEKYTKPKPELQELRYSVVLYLKAFAKKQLSEILSKDENFEQRNDPTEISPSEALLTQGTKHLRALSASKVITAIVELLYDYENQLSVLLPLLELVSAMVNYSRLAYELCKSDILRVVFEAMFIDKDFRNPAIQLGFQIFWLTIEGVGVECLGSLVSQDNVWLIHGLFVSVIKDGYKLDDKCLRNEILILINYLLSLPEAVEYFLVPKNAEANKKNPSLLEVLFDYAVVDESKFYENKPKLGDRKTLFGTNSEDLEFKKLIWSGLLMSIESGHEEVIALAQKSEFIKYLLLYVDSENSSYAITRWSGPQLRELQQHALSILADVILHMKDDFEAKRGIFCLTKFLSNVTDVERREKCLRAFVNASLFEEQYKLKISEQGLLDYLIEFLQSPESPAEIRELCFTILANLCKDCKKNRKMFREKNGIELIVSGLREQKLATSDRYTLLALALLNCLWNAVLGSRRSEEVFINSQGVFDLLEFVQICAYSHRKMALSCLCFLVENQKAVNEFLDWNGESTMVNATQLLIRIYNQEDDRFGVKYKDGVVSNKERPLVPNGQKKDAFAEAYLKDFTTSGTETYLVNRIKEVVGASDLRVTIFSILYRVGFSKNELNAMEQQKMEVIQLYPHFKMGEIWAEILRQLREEGVQPTKDDEHWLETSLEEFSEKMNNCVNTQTLIKKEFNQNEERELERFFQVIKYNKQIK